MLKFTFSSIVVFTAMLATAYTAPIRKQVVVYFQLDSSCLDAANISIIRALAQQINEASTYVEVSIDGHTDSDGSSSYNQQLSVQRVQQVLQRLKEYGIEKEIILNQTFGESKPIASNSSIDDKSKNRRVEITVDTYNFENLNDVYTELNINKNCVFRIDVSRDTMLVTPEGFTFTFPAYTWVSEGDKPIKTGNIDLQIQEVKQPYQSIVNNISCTSPEGILQSGGMFQLLATANNQTVKPTLKGYKVQLPNENAQSKMSVYTGKQLANGTVSWVDTKQGFNEKSDVASNAKLVLDLTEFKKWEITPRFSQKLDTFKFNLPTRPSVFRVAKQPREIPEPNRNLKLYQLSWITRMLHPAATVEQNSKLYLRDLAIYNRRMEVYDKRLNRYTIDTAVLKTNQLKYDNELAVYKQKLLDYAAYLNLFYHSLSEQNYINKHQRAKKKFEWLYKNNQVNTENPFAFFIRLIKNDRFISNNQENPYWDKYNKLNNALKVRLNEVFTDVCSIDEHDNTWISIGNIWTTPKYNYIQERIKNKAVEKEFAKQGMAYWEQVHKDRKVNVSQLVNYYQATLNNTDWVNCDRFYSVPKEDKIMVTVPKFKNANAQVYAYLPSINAMLSLQLNTTTNMYQTEMPKNLFAKLVYVCIDADQQLYYDVYESNEIKGDIKIDMLPKKIILADLKSKFIEI